MEPDQDDQPSHLEPSVLDLRQYLEEKRQKEAPPRWDFSLPWWGHAPGGTTVMRSGLLLEGDILRLNRPAASHFFVGDLAEVEDHSALTVEWPKTHGDFPDAVSLDHAEVRARRPCSIGSGARGISPDRLDLSLADRQLGCRMGHQVDQGFRQAEHDAGAASVAITAELVDFDDEPVVQPFLPADERHIFVVTDATTKSGQVDAPFNRGMDLQAVNNHPEDSPRQKEHSLLHTIPIQSIGIVDRWAVRA